ncbi:hypothetical protein IRB23SM22_07000 [Alkalibacterium sp. s-m-22]|uniref:DUF5067 domain-containing protein n=1 Tax=Alkalibacterium indicireducens TaxID=398758 RepID=A0ABN1B230_9LACT
MKKLWLVGIALLIMAGCDNGEVPSSADDEVVSEDIEEPVDTEDDESEGEVAPVTDDSVDTEEVEQGEEMAFVLQISDEASGLSAENDEVLSLLKGLVEESVTGELGEDGEVRAQYSGLFLTDETSLLYVVFLLSNRSQETMTNIGLTLSVVTDDTTIFENKQIYLDQEHFGVLEPNTVMPVYVELDVSQLGVIEELSDSRQETTYISNVMYDIPGENPDSRDPEGYEAGYRPEYILMESENGQSRSGEWEENSPELEYVIPENLEDEDISLALLQVENVLDLAQAESIANDVTIFWTGVAQQNVEEDNWEGIFLLMNRTGMDYKNIEFGFTLEDETGNVVFENQSISLPEDEFGVFRDGTMIPIFIPIPDEGEEAFMGILERYGAMYRFESWEAE